MTAEIRPIRTAAETGLVSAFEAVRDRLPGDAAGREQAFSVVAEGLPHRRVEEWKYTDLRALMRDAKPLAAAPDMATLSRVKAAGVPLAGLDAYRLVFVNGALVAELSDTAGLPAGVELVSLADAFTRGSALTAHLGTAGADAKNTAVALVGAFATDGVLLRVAEGVVVEKPIHISVLQDGDGHAAYLRALVVAEKGASVKIIESHSGAGAHQTASLLEVILGDGAKVDHVKLQNESLSSLHLATLAVKLGGEAEITSVAVARGSQVARQQLYLTYAGENAKASMNGISLVGARRHLDTTLFVDHAKPGGESRERFKAVLDGEGRFVFQGKILVQPEAQKTDGRMKADALLLSEGSEADLKPELEIYADDVLCAHGATAAALDDEQLFYLMARGVPRLEAQSMLVHAFVGEVLDLIENEPLREAIAEIAEGWHRARD